MGTALPCMRCDGKERAANTRWVQGKGLAMGLEGAGYAPSAISPLAAAWGIYDDSIP
jgi:hypothetical protein